MSLRPASARSGRPTLRRRVVLVLLLAAGMLGVTSAAYAYWTSHGAGSASATTGTLAPPTAVVATSVSGSTTVSASWTASTGSPVPQGYYVVRTRLGDSSTAPACGTSPTSLRTTTSCSDTSVPDGDFSYAVTAVYRSWTATSASSASVHVGVAARLAFSTQPGGGSRGLAWSAQPVVVVQDASGATVTGGSAAVQLTLTTVTGGPGALTCTSNPLSATGGVATFSSCSVNTSGTYRLTASSGTLTTALSSTFIVTAGAANKLVFSTQPSASSSSQVALAQQPVVTVQDAGGATVTTDTSAVTLSLTSPGGATLACTANPKTAVAGVTAFAGCKVDKAGTYTLTATDGSLSSATSTSFAITAGPAVKLSFTTPPSPSSASQVAFAQQPAVTIQDAVGNTVTTDTSSVTLALTTPGGATLACTNNPKAALSGIVTFAGCMVDKAGTYTLTAADGSLTSAASTSFAITPGAATKLIFSTATGTPSCPTGVLIVGPGGSLTTFVSRTDAFGNPVPSGAGLSISVTKDAGGGGDSPTPSSMSIGLNASVTSGSTLLKLPQGNPPDTTYRATAAGLTAATCQLRKN